MELTAGFDAPAARTAPAPGVEQHVTFLSGPDGAIFYSVHTPVGGAHATLVMCPPFLADHAFGYRREHLLALELARRGVATWRFHYAGTGYSDGSPAAVTFDSMVADARRVIDTAESSAACPVTVGGTRGGAMVAAAASDNRPLLLWEPVLDGGAYLREGFRARMIADGRQLKRTAPTSAELLAELRRAGRVELVGYSLYERLHDSIVPVRLRDLLNAPGERVLLIEAQASALADDLRAAGASLTAGTVGTTEAWWFHRTQQSSHAEIASQLAQIVGPWLPRSSSAQAVSDPLASSSLEPTYIRTRASSVFGLLTPPTGAPRGEAALLLWGGGGMPAFGRNQVAVALARCLAGIGYHVLQVDCPGRGDSPGAEPPDPIDEPAKQELFAAVRAAYEWLRARGLSRVLTIGSCQGAVAALNTTDAVSELAGLVLLAPPIAERFEADTGDESCATVSMLHPRMRESFAAVARSGRPILIAYGIHDEGFRSFHAAMDGELGAILRPASDRLTVNLTEERVHGFMTVSGQEATVGLVTRWAEDLA